MKLKKVIGVTLTTIGVLGTITGAVLLPVGCLSTYTETVMESGDKKIEVEKGIGDSNYLETISYKYSGYFGDELKQVKEIYEEMKEQENNETRKLKESGEINYLAFVGSEKVNYHKSKNILDSGKGSNGTELTDKERKLYEEQKKFSEKVSSAYDMMVAGSVLLALFVVVMLIGVAMIVASKKKVQ